MNVNPLWVPWILAFSFQHYLNKVGTDKTLIIPSQETPVDLNSNRSELIFAGPDFTIVTSDFIKVEIRFNILTVTNKDPTNIYFHYEYLSDNLKFFTACIPIYKYGSTPNNPDFNQTQVGVLNLVSDIKTTDIRPFDPLSRQQVSTLEAHYTGDLDGSI